MANNVIEDFIVTKEDILHSVRKLNMSKAASPDRIFSIESIDIFF